jgi:hypothetical protein
MIGKISAAWQAWLDHSGLQVTLLDRTTGQEVPISSEIASAPDGLLPVFLAAADAVWRDATGHDLGITLQPEPKALLGYRVQAIGGPLSAVLLSMADAAQQVIRSNILPASDLPAFWAATEARCKEAAR